MHSLRTEGARRALDLGYGHAAVGGHVLFGASGSNWYHFNVTLFGTPGHVSAVKKLQRSESTYCGFIVINTDLINFKC